MADWMDSARSLFGSSKKRIRDLSSSVVRHDRFDDGVLDDFIDRASHFRRTLDTPPLTPKVRMPKREDFKEEDEYDEAMRAAGEKQTELDEKAEGYAGWPHDVKDTFRAYHTWDEPSVMAQGDIRPSRELGRQVMQRLILSDAFSDSRPHTRHSDVEAALATMAFSERLKTELETTLAEHVERAQEASEHETKIDQADRLLEKLREQAKQQKQQQGQVDPQLVKQVRETIQSRRQSAQALNTAAQRIEAMGTAEVADAVNAAAEEAEEMAEMAASLPGNEPGSDSHISPEQAFALAQRWKDNSTMRRIVQLLGRMKRAMKFERATRVVGGREEVVDFEVGADLALVLPHELAGIAHPLLRLDFIRRFLERSLLQYEMVGEDQVGNGPVIMAVDGSGSMNADLGGATRNEWSRALMLATLAIAHDEKRDVYLMEYSSGDDLKVWDFPGRERLDPEVVAECASHFFNGGTDTTQVLRHSIEVVNTAPEFKLADIIIMSDGEDHFQDEDERLVAALKAKGVRFQGIAVGVPHDSYLEAACDVVTNVLDMAHGGADAQKMVATHLVG